MDDMPIVHPCVPLSEQLSSVVDKNVGFPKGTPAVYTFLTRGVFQRPGPNRRYYNGPDEI
jgi:hypothetical protein